MHELELWSSPHSVRGLNNAVELQRERVGSLLGDMRVIGYSFRSALKKLRELPDFCGVTDAEAQAAFDYYVEATREEKLKESVLLDVARLERLMLALDPVIKMADSQAVRVAIRAIELRGKLLDIAARQAKARESVSPDEVTDADVALQALLKDLENARSDDRPRV